jgi:hypothetical protein
LPPGFIYWRGGVGGVGDVGDVGGRKNKIKNKK